ncbi:MAG: class I SAM-dependent methyltransferase, partial [Chloroflexi bacterium CFX6]|nr:class I SAM-dependent methyltransferase [Chloroflexi bacterium CFX6]
MARSIAPAYGRPVAFAGRRGLDFGCVCGAAAVVLACAGAEVVVGVDADGPSLAAARVRAWEARATARFAGATPDVRLSFPDIAFDVVATCPAFEHIRRRRGRIQVRGRWRAVCLEGIRCSRPPTRRPRPPRAPMPSRRRA